MHGLAIKLGRDSCAKYQITGAIQRYYQLDKGFFTWHITRGDISDAYRLISGSRVRGGFIIHIKRYWIFQLSPILAFSPYHYISTSGSNHGVVFTTAQFFRSNERNQQLSVNQWK